MQQITDPLSGKQSLKPTPPFDYISVSRILGSKVRDPSLNEDLLSPWDTDNLVRVAPKSRHYENKCLPLKSQIASPAQITRNRSQMKPTWFSDLPCYKLRSTLLEFNVRNQSRGNPQVQNNRSRRHPKEFKEKKSPRRRFFERKTRIKEMLNENTKKISGQSYQAAKTIQLKPMGLPIKVRKTTRTEKIQGLLMLGSTVVSFGRRDRGSFYSPSDATL